MSARTKRPPLQSTAHFIGEPMLRTMWRVRALGTRHVPLTGAVILAGNHRSFADGPLMYAFSPRPLRILVKREMFKGPLKPVLDGIGHIPVDRGSADRTMITRSLGVLAEGEALGVFPEGTRGSGDFSSVHNGLAYLALRSGAPVVPVAVFGTASRGSSASAMPAWRSRVDIVFGAPFHAAGDGTPRRASRSALAEASESVRENLAAHLRAAARQTGRQAG